MSDLADLERRVAELERLLKTGELQNDHAAPSGDEHEPNPAGTSPIDPATGLIELSVTNKRYQPTDYDRGLYQEAVWFDCTLTLALQSKATRAVKGAFEFCDLFGEPRFVVGYTINDTLVPGRAHGISGVGFDYNQFMPEHQWMLSTDTRDMVVRFRVQQVLYADGTSDRLD